MKIRQVSVDKIIPYPGNPRKNQDAIDPVAASLREFGWRQPIVVDSDMVVIVGHTRLLAAQRLGLDKVPVTVADDMTPAQARAYRLADNRTGENAEWDNDLLAIELGELEGDFDLSLTGFSPDEIKLLSGLIDRADMPSLPDGDREPFQQMTFTLHDSQVEIVQAAIFKTRQFEDVGGEVNENSNGNALAYVCKAFIQ